MAKRSTAIGLDLGRYAVKAVWAHLSGGRPAITRAASFRLPSGAADPRPVIKPWLEEQGIPGKHCVLGLSGPHVMFQPFLLPPGDPRTLDQAASMEVVRFNELASETMQYGFTPFSFQAGEKRLLLAMTRETLVGEVLRQAGEYGLDVVELTPVAVALFNACESQMPAHERPYLYVDIGCSGTVMAVGTAAAGLMFARAFSSGGQMFTDSIARARKCPSNQAETIKLRHGAMGGGDAEVSAALMAAANIWATEAQACLSVYQNLFTERGARIEKAFLTGGGSALEGFAEYAAQKLGLPVERLDGHARMQKVADPWTYATAAGLAAAGLGAGPVQLTMLPEDLRDELTFREQKPYWVAAAATGALVLAVSLAGGYRDFKRKEKQLNAQKESLRRRETLAAEIDAVKASSQHIRNLAAPVEGLLRNGPTIREVISLLAENKTTNDWITLVADAESYFKEQPLSEPAGDARKPRPAARKPRESVELPRPGVESVIVEGYTRREDLSTVKHLIDRMRQAARISSVDLLGDEMLSVSPVTPPTNSIYHGAMRFVIEVKVKPL